MMRSKMKKIFASLLAATFVVGLTACGGGGATGGGTANSGAAADPDQVFTLNMHTQQNEAHPIVQGFYRMADVVYERSEGRLVLQVFPSAQLGSDDEVIEQIRMGVPNTALTDGSAMGSFVPEFALLLAPYIAESYDDMLQVLASDTFAGWADRLAEGYGIRVLSFNWYDGQRHFMTNNPVHTPADLNGIRIRTPGSPMFQESIRAMGGTPVAMPFGETYPAIQQGAVDGLEVQLSSAYTSSIYEVVSYMSRTGHFHLLNGVITSETWFRSLPDDLRDILTEEMARHGEEVARIVIDMSDEFERLMVEYHGLTVIEPDLAAFVEAASAVFEILELEEARDELFAELGW